MGIMQDYIKIVQDRTGFNGNLDKHPCVSVLLDVPPNSKTLFTSVLN